MATVTFADVFKAYVKPSLKGRLVLRKRTSNQTSSRLQARKMKVAEAKPAEEAHRRCIADGKAVPKRVYVPGKGYEEREVCPIEVFKSYLREAMPR